MKYNEQFNRLGMLGIIITGNWNLMDKIKQIKK